MIRVLLCVESTNIYVACTLHLERETMLFCPKIKMLNFTFNILFHQPFAFV